MFILVPVACLCYYPVRECTAGLCIWSRRFVYMCICVYICGQKTGCWGLTTWKSLVDVIYCLLVKFNRQKRSLLCQVIRPGKEIPEHSINGTRKRSSENCITVEPHLVYMQCSYAIACNAIYECITAWTPTSHCNCSAQTNNIATGTVCTDNA